jgi:hypothetical protein
VAHEELIDRRKALRKFGQFGLAGFAGLVGRPSMAKADVPGGYDLDEGACNGPCPKGYYCYQAEEPTPPFPLFCCKSTGQQHLNCCTRPNGQTQCG